MASRHANIVSASTILQPTSLQFSDLYVVFEAMETDLAEVSPAQTNLSTTPPATSYTLCTPFSCLPLHYHPLQIIRSNQELTDQHVHFFAKQIFLGEHHVRSFLS